MATTFKVVEFYRNNSTCLLNDSSNGASLLNATVNSSYAISASSDTTTRNGGGGVVKSPTALGAIESSAKNSSSNLLYNSLGFNVLGGYLTNMPATIVDISSSLNSKLVKVMLDNQGAEHVQHVLI